MVLASILAVGARGLVREYLLTLWGIPGPVVSQDVQIRAAEIRGQITPGEGLLYVSREPEIWFSRLWQRALFPVPVFLIQGPEDLASPRVRELRNRYRIRHALSAGRPPLDPGWLTRRSFAGPAGSNLVVSFGELSR